MLPHRENAYARVGQLIDLHNQMTLAFSAFSPPPFKRMIGELARRDEACDEKTSQALTRFDRYRHVILHDYQEHFIEHRGVAAAAEHFTRLGFTLLSEELKSAVCEEIAGHILLFGKRLDYVLYVALGCPGNTLGERIRWCTENRQYVEELGFAPLFSNKSRNVLKEFIEVRNAIAHKVQPRNFTHFERAAQTMLRVQRNLRLCRISEEYRRILVLFPLPKVHFRACSGVVSMRVSSPKIDFILLRNELFKEWDAHWNAFEDFGDIFENNTDRRWRQSSETIHSSLEFDEVDRRVSLFLMEIPDSLWSWQILQGYERLELSELNVGNFTRMVRMAMLVKDFGKDHASYLKSEVSKPELNEDIENIINMLGKFWTSLCESSIAKGAVIVAFMSIFFALSIN